MKKFKRQGGRIGGSGASSNGMFCDGKTDRVADPRDCFRALQFLYTNFPQSGCAVSGSCAMMPVTFEYTPLVTNRPKYTFQQVQASYDGLFGYYCKNYRSPITVKSDWPKNAFLSGFLLGLNAGSGVRECDSSMSQRILQETKSFSGP
ncbi:secreted protein [Melampsora americana]|nr:secreted protein [Melampsora americana]